MPVGALSRSSSSTARLLLIVLLSAALVALSPSPVQAQPPRVLVFAAASLTNAMGEVTSRFQRETGVQVAVSFAASSTLARQIENGAPADLFFSADLDWMDYLSARGFIRTTSRRTLLGNQLVLVGPRGARPVAIAPRFPLAELLAGGRLAMADTSAVPAGRYGKAALETLGVWPSVADRLAQSENVRSALALVARQEAPLGIVYRTDALAEPLVTVVGTFPDRTHPPIVYPVALTTASSSPDARTFVAYLSSPKALAVFEKQGFAVLK
jgi:molybdate transport system substrate-binding protein